MPETLVPVEIMLVEDNPHDVEITIKALERGRIKNPLIVARDGEEALNILFERKKSKKPQPGLILLDLNLPKLKGHEVLAAVKGDGSLKRIPVIVLTASNREEDVVRSYDLGVNTFITKPVEFERFIRIVTNIKEYWIVIATLPPRR